MPFARWLCLAILLGVCGCHGLPSRPTINPDGLEQVPNPLPVSMIDRTLIMDQISDELDNYFPIYREEQIRVVDSVMTEGWIETRPKIGATLLEPWHADSTPGFERLHASLQTVRRFAKVRVIPTGDSYLVDVKVFKELEDLPEPKGHSISGLVPRHDNSLDIDFDLSEYASAPGTVDEKSSWIPMGRDLSLEQKIIRNIQSRLRGILETGGPPGKSR